MANCRGKGKEERLVVVVLPHIKKQFVLALFLVIKGAPLEVAARLRRRLMGRPLGSDSPRRTQLLRRAKM